LECRARIRSSRSRKWSADCMWWASSWRFSPFQGTTSINISYSWCQTNQWGSHSPCCCIRCWIACTAPADNTGWRKRRRAYADWISGNEILCRTQTEKKSVEWSPLHAQEKRMWSIENSCGSGELSSFFAVPSRVLPAVAYSTWIWRYWACMTTTHHVRWRASWKLAGSRQVASQKWEHQRDIVQDRRARIRASLQVSP
jgi:hypothetical protein